MEEFNGFIVVTHDSEPSISLDICQRQGILIASNSFAI